MAYIFKPPNKFYQVNTQFLFSKAAEKLPAHDRGRISCMVFASRIYQLHIFKDKLLYMNNMEANFYDILNCK